MCKDNLNIGCNLKEVFNNRSEKVTVYLRNSKTKGQNYDPYRNTGYTIDLSKPRYVNVIIQTISGDRLILKELGLATSGAVSLIVKNRDITYLKMAQRILIDNENYVTWHEALGNKFIVFKQRTTGFSKVILFKESK